MTKFEQGLVEDYRAILLHIEKTVSSVHGVLTKEAIEHRDNLEVQLVNRKLTWAMSDEALQNYHYHHNCS